MVQSCTAKCRPSSLKSHVKCHPIKLNLKFHTLTNQKCLHTTSVEVLSLFKNNVNSIQLLSAISYHQHKHSPLRGISCQGILQDLCSATSLQGRLGDHAQEAPTSLRKGAFYLQPEGSTVWRPEKSNFQILVYHGTRERREVLGKSPRGKKSSLGSHCGSSEPSVPGLLRGATRANSSMRNCGRKQQCSDSCALFGGVDFTTEI